MDEKLKNQIILLMIGAIIGASGSFTNSYVMWNNSVDKVKSDIAEGLYLDISAIGQKLIDTDRDLLKNTDKSVYIQLDPIYPSKGLYFEYQHDIPQIDRVIANDTFVFYNHLLLAEQYRGDIYEIQRRGDLRTLTTAEVKQQQMLTQSVVHEVNISVSLLPKLKQDLDKAAYK